jgi:L-asparagine transporter-like permease
VSAVEWLFRTYPGLVYHLNIGVAVVTFLICVLAHLRQKRSMHDFQLDQALRRVFAAASLPTCVLLVLSAIRPQVLAEAKDATLYVAVAAMVLFYMGLKELLT